MDNSFRERLAIIEKNALSKIAEQDLVPRRDSSWYQRATYVAREPIFIASTEDIGTNRVRANHLDAVIDYCEEQEKLKAMKAPIV